MNECRINPCCQDLTSFKVMDVLERACALEKEGRDIVHLQIGEPDFDAMHKLLARLLAADAKA